MDDDSAALPQEGKVMNFAEKVEALVALGEPTPGYRRRARTALMRTKGNIEEAGSEALWVRAPG